MLRHRLGPLLVAFAVVAFTLPVVIVALAGSRQRRDAPEDWTGVPPGPQISAAQSADFVGSETCRQCHATEFTEHAASWHAHTLAPVSASRFMTAFGRGQTLYDPLSDCTYRMSAQAGTPAIHVQEGRPGRSADVTPAYAVGGGQVGTTFVATNPAGQFMETRISFYPRARRFSYTAGQQDVIPAGNPLGRVMDPGEDSRCFGCHSTTVVMDGETPHPERSLLNVGCERCHGAGRRHVEAARAGRDPGFIHRYGPSSGAAVTQLCSECHRGPGAASGSPKGIKNLPRFAGTALVQSRCYRESNGRLSCITCHNPHENVSRDLHAYERACLSCHSSSVPHGTVCPVNATSGCISCHMPARPIDFPTNPTFHLHWIKVYPKTQPRSASSRTARPAARSG